MVNILKRLHFDNFEYLANDILKKYNLLDNEYKDITIISKYDEAKEIIKELLCIGCSIASIELQDCMCEYYNDEYIISISNTDIEKGIWCEKFKRQNKYLDNESDIIYILDNCSSKVINHCKANIMYEVSIGEDNYEYEMDDAEDDIHGFTLSNTDDNGYHSFSYYTTNPLTEENIQSMIEKLGFSFSK